MLQGFNAAILQDRTAHSSGVEMNNVRRRCVFFRKFRNCFKIGGIQFKCSCLDASLITDSNSEFQHPILISGGQQNVESFLSETLSGTCPQSRSYTNSDE